MKGLFNLQMQELIAILEKHGSLDRMYNAIRIDDLSEAVMTALDILKETKLMTKIEKRDKCEKTAAAYFMAANTASATESYDEALFFYNLTIARAPPDSELMLNAYNNRSILLLKIKAINACLKDIAKCVIMIQGKGSANVNKELEERKYICTRLLIQENFRNTVLESAFGIEYLKFKEKRNKNIPCASAGVNVVKENGSVKVVAAKDIELGKVVSVEPAFVAILDKENDFKSCHYCHKMAFGLIPCDGCWHVLFCDEDCKEKCFKEYHHIECQVIDVIEECCSSNSKCKLSILAALKLREMSDSWEDLISQSLKIGKTGVEESSISEIYDHKNKKSILNFNEHGHFVHGKIFNQCFVYAVIIKYLSDIPDYMPQDAKLRTDAQRALARIMLSLYVKFPFEIDIQNTALNHSTGNITSEPDPSIGLFSFASKLTHSCEPNLLSIGLGNKLALIAVRSIKKGTELTISFLGHWCEVHYDGNRSQRLFLMSELTCKCRLCAEDWIPFNEKSINLSHEETRCLRKWRSVVLNPLNVDDHQKFRESCRALKMFQDSPHRSQYVSIMKEFRKILFLFQYSTTQNCIL